MKCEDCGYYWMAIELGYNICHYDDDNYPAPCEYEGMESEDEDNYTLEDLGRNWW